MTENRDVILPEKMSDEAAYYLVNFLMDIALALESRYFSQIRRYAEDNAPPSHPLDVKKNPPKGSDF